MDISGSEPLALRLEFNVGQGVVEAGPDDPVAAPFRRAITQGGPTGAWLATLLSRSDGPPLLFGTFVLTQRGRFLFFPAAEVVVEGDTSGLEQYRESRLEHITLDYPRKPGRFHSHVAFVDGPRDVQVVTFAQPGYLVPWFSVLLPEPAVLKVLPRVITVTFDPLRSDEQYPNHLLGDAAHVVQVEVPPASESSNFIQVDIWAGMDDSWPSLKARPVPWVFKEGVADAVPDPQSVTATRRPIEFAADRGLVVLVTRPSGVLRRTRMMRVGRWTIANG